MGKDQTEDDFSNYSAINNRNQSGIDYMFDD